jgi:hypothetical protein
LKQIPKPNKCFECAKEGHFAHNWNATLSTLLPKHLRPFAFNADYLIRKYTSGKVKVMFLGPPNKNRSNDILVTKSLVEKVVGSHQVCVPKCQAWSSLCVGELQDQFELLGNW